MDENLSLLIQNSIKKSSCRFFFCCKDKCEQLKTLLFLRKRNFWRYDNAEIWGGTRKAKRKSFLNCYFDFVTLKFEREKHLNRILCSANVYNRKICDAKAFLMTWVFKFNKQLDNCQGTRVFGFSGDFKGNGKKMLFFLYFQNNFGTQRKSFVSDDSRTKLEWSTMKNCIIRSKYPK